MIKENVLRKNLLTNEIDYGNVDSEFEFENLHGNIIQDSPWIEISEDDKEFIISAQNRQLQSLKVQKKQEIDEYWDKMRVFNIRNGMTLPCKADQNWYNTISNTIDILKTNYELGLLQDLENSTYNYSIIGTDKTIDVPYKALQLIKLTISKGRAYCRVNCDQHLNKINNFIIYITEDGKPTNTIDYDSTIQAIKNYNYKVDFATKKPAEPINDIVLSHNYILE